MQMAKKPWRKQKENSTGCTGEGKRRKRNIGEEKGRLIPLNLIVVMKSREKGVKGKG